jgi:GTP pyrophosphokinase
MQRQGIAFEQVYDILAFRIIVEEKHQCYEALGIVHNLWRPIPARFKDYIAMPKPNGYQSLHTSVIGPYREPIEIQIRTEQMHNIAEQGVAAHWVYKEHGHERTISDSAEFKWLRELIEDFQEVSDHKDFMERLKLDLFSEEVFVFTPKGDIKAFPVGATAVDFAYAIHTEVGDHCAGAKINGVMISLSQPMQSGDVIEIITKSGQHPNKDWLKNVKTGRARSKIQHYLRTEARNRALIIGKEILEAELRKFGRQIKTVEKKGALKEAAESIRLQSTDEMFIKLGYGTLSLHNVIKAIDPELEFEEKQPLRNTGIETITRSVKRFLGKKTGVRLDGIDDDLLVQYAQCCNPIPGEQIIGYITRGRGLTVHTADCDNSKYLEPERRVDVHWDNRAIRDKEVIRTIRIEVICNDTPGLLAGMSQAFSITGINIREAHCQTKDGRAVNIFDLQVTDFSQLERAIQTVRRVKGVLKVSRIRT